MAIRVICGSCQKKYRLSSRDAGRSFNCPECGNRLHVPELSQEEIAVQAETVQAETGGSDLSLEDSEPLMKPTKKINFEDLIDMTAMVDIVFFLLIYFLVTSMQTVDSAIDLPRPGGKSGAVSPNPALTEEETQDQETTVRIDRADRISVDGTEVRGPDELYLRLREARGGAGHPTVLMVVGSADATHGTLVSVLDSGQDVGFEKIKLSVTEDGEQGAASP